jgi:hypothetical protein
MTDEAEVDQLLEADPRNIEALVRKGDLRMASGDERAAAAFYKAALRAAGAAQPLPESLRGAIERAQSGIACAETSFERQLEASLAADGFPPDKRPPRFQHSLDLMLGRRQATLELQQPTSYFFPGLPQRPYYERSELPWAKAIEAQAPAIRDELLAYMAGGADGFSPYMVSDPTRPRSDYHGLVDNPDWSTLYIWEKGGRVPGLAEHFARTLAAVEALDHAAHHRPRAFDPVLAPGRGSAHSAAPRGDERAADLPPAADRPARVRLPGRRRGPRVAGRRAAGVRRQRRARGVEPGLQRAHHPDL